MPKGKQKDSNLHLQTVRLSEIQRKKLAHFSANCTRDLLKSVSFNVAITMLIDALPAPPSAEPEPDPEVDQEEVQPRPRRRKVAAAQ
jgi:hypothetical protein